MPRQLLAVLFVTAIVLAGSMAHASVTFDDIDTWIGEGDNRSVLLIDWNDGKGATDAQGASHSLAWGYRWHAADAPTAMNLFMAIVQHDPQLFVKLSPTFDYGASILGIGYNAQHDSSFAITDGSTTTTFTEPVFTVASMDIEDGHTDGHTAVNPGNRYQEGWWTDGYWGYYVNSLDGLGQPQNPFAEGSWESSFIGMGERMLVDGSWDGLSFAPGFDFTAPSTIPEPTSLALLGMGGLLILRRRRA